MLQGSCRHSVCDRLAVGQWRRLSSIPHLFLYYPFLYLSVVHVCLVVDASFCHSFIWRVACVRACMFVIRATAVP